MNNTEDDNTKYFKYFNSNKEDLNNNYKGSLKSKKFNSTNNQSLDTNNNLNRNIKTKSNGGMKKFATQLMDTNSKLNAHFSRRNSKNSSCDETKFQNEKYGKKLNSYWIKNKFQKLKDWIKEQCILNQFNTDKKEILKKLNKEFDFWEVPILVIKDTGRIEQVNPSLMNISKQMEEEITGENLNIILPEQAQNVHEIILPKMFNDEKYFDGSESIDRQSLIINKYQKLIPVKQSVEFRKSFCEGTTFKQAVCQVEPQDADQKSGQLVIHPNNSYQLVWTFTMLFLIIAISVVTPQNLVQQGNVFLQNFELCADFLFLSDCALNFNVGFQDDKVNQVILDRERIIDGQIKGMFLFDLLSSIPFSLMEQQIAQGFIFKIFKVIRFARLIKVAKVTKSLTIVKNFFRSEAGRQWWELIQDNLGAFKLLEIVVTLFFMAHYYGCLFIYIEIQSDMTPSFMTKVIYKEQSLLYWFHHEPFNVQQLVMIEFIQLGLGYSSIRQQNNIEFITLTIWMLLGFGFFSFSIGNASYYILMENEDNVKFKNLQKSVQELDIEQELTEDLVDRIMNSVNMNRKKLTLPDIRDLQIYIDPGIQNLLLMDCQDEFIILHKFFEFIPIDMLTVIERKIKQEEFTDKLFWVNHTAHEIFFLIEGKVVLYNREQKIVNEFGKHAIIGFDEFCCYQLHHNPKSAKRVGRMLNKQKRKENDGDANPEQNNFIKSSIKKVNSSAESILSSIKTNQELEDLKDEFNDGQSADEDEFEIFRQQTAMVEGIAQVQTMDQNLLMELCNEFPSFFSQIMTFVLEAENTFTIAEVTETQSCLQKFDITADEPGLMVLPNGMVQRKNNSFMSQFPSHDVIGHPIFSFLKLKENEAQVTNLRFNNVDMIYFYDYEYQQVRISNLTNFVIVKKVQQSDNNKWDEGPALTEPREFYGAGDNQRLDATKMEVNFIQFMKISGPFYSLQNYIFDLNIKLNLRARINRLATQCFINGNCDNDLQFLLGNGKSLKSQMSIKAPSTKNADTNLPHLNNESISDENEQENENNSFKITYDGKTNNRIDDSDIDLKVNEFRSIKTEEQDGKSIKETSNIFKENNSSALYKDSLSHEDIHLDKITDNETLENGFD